jgi:ATP-dependent RNA helicase DDX19/DBP5
MCFTCVTYSVFTEVTKADISLINKRLHNQLVDVKYDLEILRRDPKSPLYHVKSFEALNL